MKNIYSFTLFLILLTCNGTASCMLTTKFSRAHTGVRYKTYSYQDMQQGRRDAYQKWCTTEIKWPHEDNTQKVEHSQNVNEKKEDKMAYFKQFAKK